MTDLLHDYERFVDDNWTGGSPEYTMIALAGETGEACNAHKKGMRNPKDPRHDRNWRAKKIDELGDIAYYLTRACHDEKMTLAEVLERNKHKLIERNKHGKNPAPSES